MCVSVYSHYANTPTVFKTAEEFACATISSAAAVIQCRGQLRAHFVVSNSGLRGAKVLFLLKDELELNSFRR